MSPLGLVGPGSFFLSTPPRCASTRTCISPPRTQSLQRTAPGQAEDTPLGCTHNTPRCRYCLGRPTPSQMPPRVLLMALGRIALEPVDEPGLGRAQGEPVVPGLLQRDEELPTALHRLLVQVVPALELGFERELAAQRMVRAPLAPDGDVRIGHDPIAEVQYSKILKYLLDDDLVH